jgi:hypothetical protein
MRNVAGTRAANAGDARRKRSRWAGFGGDRPYSPSAAVNASTLRGALVRGCSRQIEVGKALRSVIM